MTPLEKRLFDEMINHNIKSFTEKDSQKKKHHWDRYVETKRELWLLQEERKDKNA